MILAVIDTNVWVSALLSRNIDSATVKVFNKVFDRYVTPLYNEEILTEYREVLSRKKFSFTQEKIDKIISYIRENGIDTECCKYPFAMPDEDDRVFYEVCLSYDDSFLVTGNLKHYPAKPNIVSPAEFIRIIDCE